MALDLNDKTSSGNTLTNVNTVTEETASLPFAQSTSAADFERSSSQYLYAADSASLSITGDFTLEMWVKFESLPTPASGDVWTFFSKYRTDTANRSYLWFFRADIGPQYRIKLLLSNDGTALETEEVDWTPSTGTWYHVAVSYDNAGSVKFYVDGAQQGSTQTTSIASVYDGNARGVIGANNTESGATEFFDGVIDDVRVWNVVRTQSEIDNNKSVELVGNETNLVAYWPFETTLGASVATVGMPILIV